MITVEGFFQKKRTGIFEWVNTINKQRITGNRGHIKFSFPVPVIIGCEKKLAMGKFALHIPLGNNFSIFPDNDIRLVGSVIKIYFFAESVAVEIKPEISGRMVDGLIVRLVNHVLLKYRGQ
jgi:hypothetical protein